MSSSSFSPDEIRASAEVHQELGPDYGSAVIESFLDKVGKEIDARVDARMVGMGPVAKPAKSAKSGKSAKSSKSAMAAAAARGPSVTPIAIVSIIMGIPLTAIALTAGRHPAGLTGLLIIWLAIAAINIAYAVSAAHRN